MSRPLFPDFLSDTRQFDQAQEYWREVMEQAFVDAAPDEKWTALAPESDGNPILAMWSTKLRRAIRVVQLSPHPGERDLEFYVDTRGDDTVPAELVRELVIVSTPTPSTRTSALEVMVPWIATGAVRGITRKSACVEIK